MAARPPAPSPWFAPLFGAEPLRPGLCDVVGIGLLGHAPYEIARPAERHELDLALQMIDDQSSRHLGCHARGARCRTAFLFEPADLGPVLRLPLTAPGTPIPMIATGRARGPLTHLATNTRLHQWAARRRQGAPGGLLVIDLSRGDFAGLPADLELPIRRIRPVPDALGFDPLLVRLGTSPTAHAARSARRLRSRLPAVRHDAGRRLASPGCLRRGYADPDAPRGCLLAEAGSRGSVRVSAGTGAHSLRAELLGRLSLLDHGPLGSLLSSGRRLDWRELLAAPTIIELGATPILPTERSSPGCSSPRCCSSRCPSARSWVVNTCSS
ncbi:MAG: hypothetical protein R2715_12275 [Ilumatobacteraceae bacterium]